MFEVIRNINELHNFLRVGHTSLLQCTSRTQDTYDGRTQNEL